MKEQLTGARGLEIQLPDGPAQHRGEKTASVAKMRKNLHRRVLMAWLPQGRRVQRVQEASERQVGRSRLWQELRASNLKVKGRRRDREQKILLHLGAGDVSSLGS